MTFLTPISLLLLLPWAGVVAWVLFGRAEFARVSTTMFWEKTETTSTTRRGIRRPPVWAVLMLLAMLAAILAASGLGVYTGEPRVRWVVDRNLLTMTALAHDPQFRDRIDWASVVSVPESADALRPTTLDTRAAILQTVDRLVRETTDRIVVVTSQAMGIDHDRVTVFRPGHAVRNAGIDHFAVVAGQRPQAMVRVWNGTEATRATLRVDRVAKAIELPPAGQTRDYFVQIATPGEVVEAELEIEDEIEADNRAWLVRANAAARVVVAPGMSEPVRRFAAVYEQTRKPAAGAVVVAITEDAGVDSPAVVIRRGGSKSEGAVRAADHPVNRWIDWEAAGALVRESLSEVPLVGTPVVWIGDQPIVAVGAGRVEIGFDVSRLASRAELVMLMDNAIEYVGGSELEYVSVSPGSLGPGWRVDSGFGEMEHPPGVYRENAERRAVNVRAVRVSVEDAGADQRLPAGERGVFSMVAPLLSGALVLVLGGLIGLTPTRRRVRY